VPAPHLEEDDDDDEASAAPASPSGEFAARSKRFAAGLADLLLHAAILVGVLLGTRWMGVKVDPIRDWPPLALFLLSFSFLYTLLPLAFWGQTLGMAWADIHSRNRDGEPLTFDQTARRWAGRRSLSDLISGSATYPGGE
jgi:uncharacterized RDD family membrane protein YckC